MRKQLLVIATTLAVAVTATATFAEEQKSGGGYLYRYKNDKGVMVMDSSIPPEYSTKGYQVITRSGQVVQTVAPATNVVTDPEQRKALAEQNAQLSRRDGELRKLYSAPQDAERLRDRQVESINLKIDYAKGQLSQVVNKRKTELEQAARLERKGTAVPPEMRQNLDRTNKQVADLDAQVKALEADREKVRQEFAPIIERLKVIYPNKVNPQAAAAPAPAAVAAPAPAAATPAAPAAAAPKR